MSKAKSTRTELGNLFHARAMTAWQRTITNEVTELKSRLAGLKPATDEEARATYIKVLTLREHIKLAIAELSQQ